MMLRGELTKAFGNILCLRGFATLGDLEKLSFPDESYQRDEIESHRQEITEFLDSGEYTFFPEIILGASLERLSFSNEDVNSLYEAVSFGNVFKVKNNGVISISTFVKRFKQGAENSFHIIASINKLKEKVFSRIDGNHRLQAVKGAVDHVKKYLVPFCLVLFRNDEECQRFGRVFFHMINFRAKPISEEHNLHLILDEDDFSDERLLRAPFGPEFFLARICLKNKEIHESIIKELHYTMIINLFRYLINILNNEMDQSWSELFGTFPPINIEGKEQLLKLFVDKAHFLENLLANNSELNYICLQDENILASLMLMSFRICDISGYIAWLIAKKRNGDLKILKLSFEKIIELFEAGCLERHHKIFISMQFGSCGTEQNFKTIKTVVEELNKNFNIKPKLEIVRVDQVVTGKTFEINEKVINEIAQCGYLIADLTYCNSNVYHEIGMLMGRTLALTSKSEYNMALILDRQVSQENKIVKFNLQSLQYFAFSSQDELKDGITKRLSSFYKL